MSEPSKTVLWANALVKSLKKPNQFYCYVCPDETSFASWQDHISKASHIETLEKFNATFESQGTNVRCKLCDKNFARTEIKTHAKMHSNCVDNYQRLFENNIIEWKDKFYCCLCDVIFLDSVTAIEHIEKSTHKNLKGKSAPSAEFTASIPPNESYKLLVSEGLSPVDNARLTCKFCKIDIAFSKTREHVHGFCHWYFKINFDPTTAKRKTTETDTKAVSQNKNATESTKSSNESSLYWYFEKIDKTSVCCKVCDCFFEDTEENTKLHLQGKIHMDSLHKCGCDYISLKGGILYYCECCKLSFSDRKMLHLHIKEKSHTDSMLQSSKLKLLSSSMETTKSEVVPTNIPCNYIVRLNAMDFYCKVCDVKLSEAKIIGTHSWDSSHEASLSKYGCDGISMRGFNDYHCKYCNCCIPGRDNVFLHIKGRKHSCNLLISRRHQLDEKIKKNAEEAKPERPEWSKALSSMIDELTKLSEQLKPKNKAKKPRPSRNFANKPIKVELEQTPCNFCSSIVTSGADLHCHMAGHFTKDFVCSRVDTNCNHRENPHLAKAEEKQKKIDGAVDSPSPLEVSLNNNIDSYQNYNDINDVRTISNSSARITGNCAPVKVVAIKDTKEDSNTNDISTISEFSSKTSVKRVLPKIGAIKMNDFSTIFESTSTITDNNVPVENVAIEDPEVSCKPEKNSLSSDQKSSDGNTNDNSAFSKPSSVTSCNCNHSDDEYSSGSEAPEKVGQLRKTTMRKIIKLLDFDKDYIYEMKEKKRLIELGIRLSLIINHQYAYCLICRQRFSNTPRNYFEHLSSLDHIEYLEGMEKDHALFEIVNDQFSELDLAYQYMEEITEEIVQCLICDEEITNDDYVIQNHIEEENHEFCRDDNYIVTKQYFQDFELRMECDWYNVHKYWCVPCSANFESEVNFVKHLESKKHSTVTSKRENREKTMMFDFCAPCALLWYGYRCTYSYHCDVPSHKWLLRDGHYSLPGLPELAKNLLGYPEKFVDDTVNYLDSVAAKEKEKEKGLIEDLEKALGRKNIPAKAYVYGSRASDLGSPDSDIDVFLDFNHRYNGNVKSENLFNLMNQVDECLTWNSEMWDVNELLMECRPPVIRANHRASGLSCDISVENGLYVENTKLVKSFNEIFPPCRKLILFLKQWLVFCNLSGSEHISNYALCWYVIFYLQKQSILPSVATLISMNKRSKTVAGWEVGVTHDFSYNEFESPYSLKEHLIGFFKFYANFNFRYDVACPLLGEEIEKRAFTDPRKLPKEMAPYIAYIEKSSDTEPLRIDSVMCIQDPFDLQHNITKAVSKVFLCRFRTCCSKSLDVLCS